MAPEVFFLATADGQRLCIYHAPATEPARVALLYIHPFAEEMNKSRRMAALQARALAAQGCAVLQIDLLGCGDSSGGFGDATWAAWLADVDAGIAALRARCGGAPLWLWGLRAGGLLAGAATARHHHIAGWLLWQPALQGRVVLQQFLRLKSAAALLDGGGKGVVEGLRAELAAGRTIDVAGYTLGPGLALPLDATALAAPPAGTRVVWLEVGARDDLQLLPASAAAVERWRSAGVDIHAKAVRGPAFWQTVEIEDAPALLAATCSALSAQPEAVVT